MAYDYSELQATIKQWVEHTLEQQWFTAADVASLLEITANPPTSLTIHAQTRPLIVAFMGGTGVGKSSLLNRLAGQAIAQSGIERPTSREVTLYHHQSVSLGELPADLPVQKITLAQHHDVQQKNSIWIDMPDFDSTESHNKQLVLQWLPYIDVLIYVVSPERYKDGKAWRLLQAEGARHGWLFVLNQWDKGSIAQYDDFTQQLHNAGFTEPFIFRTSCTEFTEPDEFNGLLSCLETLTSEKNIQQLALYQSQLKKQQLKQQLLACQGLFAETSAFATLTKDWQQQWQKIAAVLTQGFLWNLQHYAKRYALSNTDVMVRQQPLQLWDEWAQTRFNDGLDALLLTADQLHIACLPLKNRFIEVKKQAGKQIEQQTELSCRTALIKPGNAVQRGVLKLVAICAVLFPLTALSGVGYQVFVSYYESSLHHQAYLGVDFVAHSSLLILISWALPYFVQKKMQPSLEKAALRGLKKGLATALLSLENGVFQALALHQQEQAQKQAELAAFIAACDKQTESANLSEHSPLTRILKT